MKSLQKTLLLRNGLADKYNASVTKFVLSANHGMAESSHQTIAGDAAKPLNIILFNRKPNDATE
jgi:hypothetical protein